VRDAEPATAAPRIAVAAVIGIVLGTLLLGLSRLGKFGAAIGTGVWSIACVVTGTVLLLAWFATKHVYMANNPSVALLNPAWLIGLVAAVMIGGRGATRAVRSAMRWLLVAAVAGSAGKVLLGHGVSALEIAALVLPGHAAAVYAADRYRRVDGVVR